ncbi:MAG: citrate (Si)-synthase, eukaryotic [Bacteroidetes bacterium]|nr:citrate (Si)-synthase, eukaryotic [Bacteroidota bacterium]
MDALKNKFIEKAKPMAAEVKAIIKEHGDVKLGEYTVAQVYQGMKSMTGLVTETSKLDPEEGIRFRGYTIPELREQLPKAPNGTEPLPEGIFWLMLTGDLPTKEEVYALGNDWARRAIVPKHVFDTLEKLPASTHPMTMFSIGVMAMQTESLFAKAYKDGVNKKDYWMYTYEDSMNLIARLPRIAAYIYRKKYKNDVHIEPDPKLDWAANIAHMMGFDEFDVKRLMRLYMTIHADHEGGNVSAHTTHLVGSALADPYLAFAAGMNGLAGPLHGLANQEVISWILQMRKEIGADLPTEQQISDYIHKTLTDGRVVPGYGHAVLRKTDPRFAAQQDFYNRYIKAVKGVDPICEIVQMIYKVAPPILESTGKIKNPWPNVDAHSGALLMHFGITEFDFYTVLFGVSRSLGVLASLVWDRALGSPIERPGSITTEGVKKKIGALKKA